MLKAIPDAGFATFLPDDAKFRVSRYEVTLVRGKRPAIGTMTFNGPQADLSAVVNAYREGDRLYVEVKGRAASELPGQRGGREHDPHVQHSAAIIFVAWPR